MNTTINFQSVLAEQMRQFVAFKRMQGYDYTDQARKLSYFDRFLYGEYDGVQVQRLNLDSLKYYAATTAHLKGSSRYRRLSSLREFSRYLHARCPKSALLPKDIVPLCKSTVRFYRIEPEQVTNLMTAATTVLPPERIQTHAIGFLIGLLYCTGLRISEALNLTLSNIDMPRSMLHVAKGKFSKQRLVPMSPSTLTALNNYLAVRNPYAGTQPSSALFIGAYDKALTYQQAYRGFLRLGRHCGTGGKPLPRLHDLRHNYACRRLALWRAEGRDIYAMSISFLCKNGWDMPIYERPANTLKSVSSVSAPLWPRFRRQKMAR